MAVSSIDFLSLEQYKNHIYQGTERALQKTLDDIKSYLLTTIKQIVYDDDATWYKDNDYEYREGLISRNYTLLQSYAWDVKYWGRENGYIAYGLEFDDAFYDVHGVDPLYTIDDFISVLDENAGDLFTDNHHPEGWWTNFIAWVESSFDDLFVKHLAEEGINTKKNVN